MSDLALAQKLLSDAKSLRSSGDTDAALTAAYRALGCVQNDDEVPGLAELIEGLEAGDNNAHPKVDKSKTEEAADTTADTGAAVVSVAAATKKTGRPTIAPKPPASAYASTGSAARSLAVASIAGGGGGFGAFLAAGGYRAFLQDEEATAHATAANPHSPTLQPNTTAASPVITIDDEDADQKTKKRVRMLLIAAGVALVTIQGARIYWRHRGPSGTETQCAGTPGMNRSVVMPDLRQPNERQPRIVTQEDVQRLVQERRRDKEEQQDRAIATHRATIAMATQATTLPGEADQATAPAVSAPENYALVARPQQHREPNRKSSRTPRKPAEPPRAIDAAMDITPNPNPRPRSGRFFQAGAPIEAQFKHNQTESGSIAVAAGTVIKATLDLGITSSRHGEVLAQVTAPVLDGGKVVIPAGAMLQGRSEDDGRRVYVNITHVVIQKERHALRAVAISGDLRGLTPKVIKASVGDRQSAEITRGTLDVARDLAVASTGTLGEIADRVAGGAVEEGRRAQEPTSTVILLVPAGQQFDVKVLP